MTNYELEPLVRGKANEAERRLLASAKDDGSKPGSREAMLAALGVPPLPARERWTERVLRGSSGASYVHGGVLLLFIGAAIGVGVAFERSSESTPPTVSIAAPVAARVSPPESSSASADPRPSNEVVVARDSLPSAPAISTATTKAIVAVPSARPSTDPLAAEIARVEAARAALGRGEPEQTLRLLSSYDREFSHGAFAVEVSVLRVEALVRAGRVDEARRLGAQFLEQHREGAFARRVRATLATSSDTSRHDGSSVE